MSQLRRRQATTYRQAFALWERTVGRQYYEHTPNTPNYIIQSPILGAGRKGNSDRAVEGHQVFPSNRNFISQPVLSDELKDAVYRAVTVGGSSMRKASVDYNMDIRRVGAVIRLKEIEKQWKAQGKQLATVYAKAVMEMLPQSPLRNPPVSHEPINDLVVHPSTKPQLFWPVAESQRFTRVEAGQAFAGSLLPAEARIPHPQLYKIAKSVAKGNPQETSSKEEWERIEKADVDSFTQFKDRTKKKEARTTTVQTPRWQYKFESVTVDKGSVGRFVDGIGQRYGVPHQDRKKGHQETIPKSVIG